MLFFLCQRHWRQIGDLRETLEAGQKVGGVFGRRPPVLPPSLRETRKEDVELVEGVLFEVVRQQIELGQSRKDLFVLALDVVKELAHDRRSELAFDPSQLPMNSVELSLQLIQLRDGVDGTLDSDSVDKLIQALVKGLKIVGVGHRTFAEVLEDPAEELIKRP